MELIKRASAFLFEIKSINTPQLRPEAVMPEFAQAVLKASRRRSARSSSSLIPHTAGLSSQLWWN